MNRDIGWMFPPTSGGAGDGFNDSGIAAFMGSPMSSLARETIQNSLDARSVETEPVHVEFELIELDSSVEFGKAGLADTINACRESSYCDDSAQSFLRKASGIVAAPAVTCLRVSDRNTTGLRDDTWRALVKTRGLSIKPGEGAGGSHGIGKAAPFAVSALRTVFYWTHYRVDGKSVERLQGKSVLLSHMNCGEETQGTGFYGIRNGCRELTGTAIPRRFRIWSRDGALAEGTSLNILGFRAATDWQVQIAESVIANYFHAIGTGKLTVIVEPDQRLLDRDLTEINADTLPDWFGYLGERGDQEHGDLKGRVADAEVFSRISSDDSILVEKEDRDLGHCKLWIKVGEGLPSKVGFVRNTGMLITTRQRGLIRFIGFKDFAALCAFEATAGNELLRLMENPQHDRFEPNRLPEDQRDRGRRALRRITKWIRDEIKKRAGPPQGTGGTVLSELAAYLPDVEAEEQFDDASQDRASGKEAGFGERIVVRLRPAPRPSHPGTGPDVDTEDGEDAGEGLGNVGGDRRDEGKRTGGGDGTIIGSGEGEGEGGTGTKGGRRPAPRAVPVWAVRLLPAAGEGNEYELSFRSAGQGRVALRLEEAGDSSPITRDDIRVLLPDGSDAGPLDTVRLADDGRTTISLTADGPIGGRAWRLTAVEVRGT